LAANNDILRPAAVRGTNSAVVLQLLRRHGRLSRADVARQSGLSEGTVSRITAELMERRLVSEDGSENSTGGRPATRLRLNDYHLSAAVEIRKWETQLAIVTLSGKFIEQTRFATSSTPRSALRHVEEQLKLLCGKYDASRLKGVGVSVGGLVNTRTGVVEVGSIPGWVHVPIQQVLQAALGVPVAVDNNVRLGAIAEYNSGSLLEVQHSHTLLFVHVDEGVGIGIVLDGSLYYGPRDSAGEFGEMIIADSAGNAERASGTLERLASNIALCERYAVLSGTGTPAGTGDTTARVRRISQRALAGDTAALDALRVTCRYLSIGIANVIWGLDADAVVLDAVINEAWPVIRPMIESEFPQNPELTAFRRLVLRPSSLGSRGSIIGAAALPFQSLFNSGEARRTAVKSARVKENR
jgi:predicted NBD/HSP70 family sugar kinase